MPSLESLLNKPPESKNFFGLFIGRSGDGKSVAEASFPKSMKVFDFDFRVEGIIGGVSAGCLPDVKGIDFDQYNTRDGGSFDKFNNELQILENARKAGTFPYRTITVDSLFSMCRMLIIASHGVQGGKKIGNLRVSGPGDYGFEVSGTHQIFDFLRMLPCNLICSAHIIDKYGKLDRTKEYSESGVVGEKLTVRDQLGESVLAYFSNVFRFSREVVNNRTRFYVEFSTDLAKNSYGIGAGRHDITGKNFYEYLQKLIKDPSYKKPEE
jgi:hypothetical protein